MNAQRQVVRNVWKGWSIAKHPLIVTPVGYKKDHDDPSPSLDDNSSLSWTEKFANKKHKLKTSSELLKLLAHCETRNDQAFDANLNNLQCSFEHICAFYEDNGVQRLDVFPVRLNDLSFAELALPTASKVQKPVKVDVCVQTDVDYAEAKDVPISSKAKGNLENELGIEMAELGLGEEALNAWKTAAASGSAEALYNLAMCYINGEYVPKNIETAIQLWGKASSLGHSLSTYQLAVCYLNGYGSKNKDVEYGWNLMEKSADAGCAEAHFSLAARHLLSGNFNSAEKHLLDAVRKKEFFDKVSGWLRADSVPAHVKGIAKIVLDSSVML